MWIKRAEYNTLKGLNATLSAQVFAKTDVIKDLLEQVRELKDALAAERARSDVAVDRLLAQKGVAPVTPVKAPTLEDLSSMFEEDPTEVRSIREAIKEQGAGNVLLGNT